jgi:hypothetical protein
MSEEKNFKICLPKVFRPAPSETRFNVQKAVAIKGKYWDRGYALKIHFLEGTVEQILSMQETIEEILAPLSLTAEYVDDANLSDIRISFTPGIGSWSYLGTDCRFISKTQPTLNLGWSGKDVERHEFCHALNLSHEHQNPNGGIQWNEEVVIAELSGPPNYWDEATIRYNVLDAYSFDEVDTTNFDGESIMLYYFPEHWTLNNVSTNNNFFLSVTDREFLTNVYGEVDTMAPVLTIHGDEQMILEYGEPYIELGASAIDNKDGDISTSIQIIGEVDSEVSGLHPVLYSVHDRAGNHTEKVRNVYVKEEVIEPTEPVEPEPTEPTEPVEPEPIEPPIEEEKESKVGLIIGIIIVIATILGVIFLS